MRPTRLTRACALLSLAAACGPRSPSTGISTRDSAGITIIEHPAAALAAAPAWSTGPATVTISAGSGDAVAFTRVVAGTRLSDGRIVVIDVDAGTTQPMLFAADGKFERKLGRPGGGPGEFQFATIAGVTPGDTILFWDTQAMRLTRMLPSGDLVGSQTVDGLREGVFGAPLGRLADGRLLSLPFVPGDSAPEEGVFRSRGPVVLLDVAHQKLDTLTMTVPTQERFMTHGTFQGEMVSFPAPVPYGSTSQVVPAGEEVLVSTNATPEVATYDVPWQLRRVVRFDRARLPVDAAARESFINYNLAEIERRSARLGPMKDVLIKHTREARFADSMGYYSSTLLAADSSLWLAEMRPMTDSTPTHLVLGTDGKLKARISLPLDARLLWAGADEVLIIMRDEDDVERLELRPIIKTAATP